MFRLDRLATWILISAVVSAIVYTYFLSKTIKQQDDYIDELSEELSTTRAEIRAIAFRVNSELQQQFAPKQPAAVSVPAAAVSVPAVSVPAAPAAPAAVTSKQSLLVIHEEPAETEEEDVPEAEAASVPAPEPAKTKSGKTKKTA